MGVIITRVESLQEAFYHVFLRFLEKTQPDTVTDILEHISLSVKDQSIINKMLEAPKEESYPTIARKIYTSKFGSTTTHIGKLHLRINRGVGNPCPLVLIGIGADCLREWSNI